MLVWHDNSYEYRKHMYFPFTPSLWLSFGKKVYYGSKRNNDNDDQDRDNCNVSKFGAKFFILLLAVSCQAIKTCWHKVAIFFVLLANSLTLEQFLRQT